MQGGKREGQQKRVDHQQCILSLSEVFQAMTSSYTAGVSLVVVPDVLLHGVQQINPALGKTAIDLRVTMSTVSAKSSFEEESGSSTATQPRVAVALAHVKSDEFAAVGCLISLGNDRNQHLNLIRPSTTDLLWHPFPKFQPF